MFLRFEDYFFMVGFTFGGCIGWMLAVDLVVWCLWVSFWLGWLMASLTTGCGVIFWFLEMIVCRYM